MSIKNRMFDGFESPIEPIKDGEEIEILNKLASLCFKNFIIIVETPKGDMEISFNNVYAARGLVEYGREIVKDL